MKVYLEPNPGRKRDAADGGIRRVIDAQIKLLPRFGVQVTCDISKADITAGHVDHAPIAEGKPFVSHCHGLMWNEYFDEIYNQQVNCSVVDALKQADAITVPSKWVANALGYGLLRTPRVVYHGVDLADWVVPSTPGDYVLWNKARADAVSDPQDLQKLAAQMPKVKFVSTLGIKTSNVKICGVRDYKTHRATVTGAGVYLATARETFGIGTLEAMACGIPIAGWDYGGQAEIIVQGETGYLAPYEDYNALAECVDKCFAERARLGANARADVEKRWQWIDKIEQYANLYKEMVSQWTEPRPKVSVIVTCHNLAKYLPDALHSLEQQMLTAWECIIVDDVSTDNTASVAEEFVRLDSRFRYVRTPENLKLPRALNFGHAQARGKYVLNLDADNLLPENALEILSDALDKRRELHIVYGGLDTISDDGTNRQANAFPYPVFNWYEQMAHLNQLHSSAMMRREVVEQSGGYRERQWRAEDAEFWSRVSSFGFRIERVTDQATLIYRWRKDSKSMVERRENSDVDGDWCEYLPWRTAKSGVDGKRFVEQNPKTIANPDLVPFGAQVQRTDQPFWNVYHRQNPLVSVIIPVGQGHLRYLNDTLDSLVGQTMNGWEAVVVNDTGDDWDSVPGAPFTRVFKTTGKTGAGTARNFGLTKARGQLCFFLDADDMLKPEALARMTRRYARGDCGYVYCDAMVPDSEKHVKLHITSEFTQDGWLRRGLHSQAVLMATADARRIGFDEAMPGWEDWDFFIRCIIGGICGAREGAALLLYRKHLGQRSGPAYDKRSELWKVLGDKYQDYIAGAKKMTACGGGCGGKSTVSRMGKMVQANTAPFESDAPIAEGRVRLEYTGGKTAPITVYANGHGYRVANTAKWRYIDVLESDVPSLLRLAVLRPVPVKQPVVKQPIVEKPVEIAKPVIEPVSAPKVDATAMQAAVAALEEKTRTPIQPPPPDPLLHTKREPITPKAKRGRPRQVNA